MQANANIHSLCGCFAFEVFKQETKMSSKTGDGNQEGPDGYEIPSKRRKHDEDIGQTTTAEPSFMEKLADTLYEHRKLAAVSAGGCASNLPVNPKIIVNGIGPVEFPISQEKADQLISVCEKAPYGKGMETVIDEKVRKTWQLNPSNFSINNAKWESCIKELVDNVGQKLGFDGKCVEARLYKFLLYEEGSHFKEHRDSEKSPGMFATLIVQLPSIYEGGNLVVQHGDMENVYDFQSRNTSRSKYSKKLYYAAHFSDVMHKAEAVTKGHRCVLIYNLYWNDFNATRYSPTTLSSKIKSLLLNEWNCDPEILVFPLDHMYSETGITNWKSDVERLGGSSSLKGFDAMLATALKEVNEHFEEDEKLSFYISNAKRETIPERLPEPEVCWSEILNARSFRIRHNSYGQICHDNFDDFGYSDYNDYDYNDYDDVDDNVPYYGFNYGENNYQWKNQDRKEFKNLIYGKKEEKPKYLRDKSSRYAGDFANVPIVYTQTFDGRVVLYPECSMLNLERCLVAHEFDSEKFWSQYRKTISADTGNEGMGTCQIFHHALILAVKKSKEEGMVYEKGKLEHIVDYVFQKRKDPLFKERLTAKVQWLVDNWKTMIGKTEISVHDSVDKMLHIIVDLQLCDLFNEFIDKATSTSLLYEVIDSKGGFLACILQFPMKVIKRILLKIFSAQTRVGYFSYSSEKSNLFACLQYLEKFAKSFSQKDDFNTFCEDIAKSITVDIVAIKSASNVVVIAKKFEQSLPIIVKALPYRLIEIKSKFSSPHISTPWVHFIKELADANLANISKLVDVALPGMEENKHTAPEDVVKFINLLKETKPQFDVSKFIEEQVALKSTEIGCIDLLKSLKSAWLGNAKILADIAFCGVKENVANAVKRNNDFGKVTEFLSFMKDVKSSSDIKLLVDDLVKKKSSPRDSYEWWSCNCLELIRCLVKAKLATLIPCIRIALPGMKESVGWMKVSDLMCVINALLVKGFVTEVKEFTCAISAKCTPYVIKNVLLECEKKWGKEHMKKEELMPIVNARIKWLEVQMQSSPWCMPEAEFSEHPKIQKADEFVSEFNSRKRGFGIVKKYTAYAEVNKDSQVSVKLVKTKKYYNERAATISKYAQECEELKQRLEL